MRSAARAEVISARSIEAIGRPNRVVEGAKPIEAVLDIVVPFLKARRIAASGLGIIYVYQIPATTRLFA